MEEKKNKYQSVKGSNAFEEMLKKENMDPELIDEVMEKIKEPAPSAFAGCTTGR